MSGSTKGNDIVKKHRYLCQLNNNIVTTKGASASLNTAKSYFDYFLDRSHTSLTYESNELDQGNMSGLSDFVFIMLVGDIRLKKTDSVGHIGGSA